MVESLADDHAFAALDAADAGDQPGAVDGVVVEAVGGERRQLEERRAGIDQVHHALARQQLAARHVALARPLRPAQRGLGAARLQFLAPARACARHWRGIRAAFTSTVDDRIAKLPSPVCGTQRALAAGEGNGGNRVRQPAAGRRHAGYFFLKPPGFPETRLADAR